MQINTNQHSEAVRTPMDLGTIRQRLLPGATEGWGTIFYKSTAEVAQDVKLVWDNCRAFRRGETVLCVYTPPPPPPPQTKHTIPRQTLHPPTRGR